MKTIHFIFTVKCSFIFTDNDMRNETMTSDLQDQTWFIVIKYILFVGTFIISICGNSLCACIIFTRRQMKSVTNLFILNLAIGDLIYTFSIPFELAVVENNNKWIFPPFFCKVLSPLQTISMSSSLFTLTALSLARYKAILKPYNKQLKQTAAKLIIILAWLFSTLTALPHAYHQTIINNECQEKWMNTDGNKIYTLILFFVQYVIPLTIMTIAYGCIGMELRKDFPGENAFPDGERAKETKKVVLMLVMVTATFAVCTLPTSIMWLWSEFGNAKRNFPQFWDLLHILNFFDFINLAVHPLLYVYFSKKFRSEMRITFQRNRNAATISRI